MMESLTDARWFIAAGLVLVSMALVGSVIRRLPLSTATVYLVVGVVLGPLGLGLLLVDPVAHAPVIELVTEVAVVISLFTAGLKLRLPLRDRAWLLPIRLASVAMVLTIAMVTAVGMLGLGLSLGAAVLLGAILAPTDPVLASDVQVSDAFDRDRVRFTLTGEAGLNDGTAFPFVMLGLGLLGLHELGPMGLRWLGIDLVWAVAAGLGVGMLLGTIVGRAVIHLRQPLLGGGRHGRAPAPGAHRTGLRRGPAGRCLWLPCRVRRRARRAAPGARGDGDEPPERSPSAGGRDRRRCRALGRDGARPHRALAPDVQRGPRTSGGGRSGHPRRGGTEFTSGSPRAPCGWCRSCSCSCGPSPCWAGWRAPACGARTLRCAPGSASGGSDRSTTSPMPRTTASIRRSRA